MAAATTGRVCSVLGDALTSARVSDEAAAAAIGVSKTRVHQWRRGLAPCPVQRILALPAEPRRHVAEAIAASVGCTLAALPGADPLHSDTRAIGELAKECGEVVAALGVAMADGHLTATEADAIEHEADEAIARLVALKARCAVVRRERVVATVVRDRAGAA